MMSAPRLIRTRCMLLFSLVVQYCFTRCCVYTILCYCYYLCVETVRGERHRIFAVESMENIQRGVKIYRRTTRKCNIIPSVVNLDTVWVHACADDARPRCTNRTCYNRRSSRLVLENEKL